MDLFRRSATINILHGELLGIIGGILVDPAAPPPVYTDHKNAISFTGGLQRYRDVMIRCPLHGFIESNLFSFIVRALDRSDYSRPGFRPAQTLSLYDRHNLLGFRLP